MDHRRILVRRIPLLLVGAGLLAVCLYLILGPFAEQTPSAVWGPADSGRARIFVEPEEELPSGGTVALSALLMDPDQDELAVFLDGELVSGDTLSFPEAGTYQLSAVSPGGEDSCTIRVYAAPPSADFGVESLTMCVGETYSFQIEIPAGTEYREVEFTCSAPEVLRLQNGKAEAVAVGEATVSATLENGVRASCRVTVLPAPEAISFGVPTLTLLVGERCALEAAAPEGIGLTPIKYSVSDPAILFPEENGEWSALSAGTVQVTAETYNGLEASCEVQVLETARASFIENFEGLVQYPELPTGCEVVSLAAILRYYGFDVDKTVLADEYMPQSYTATTDIRTEFFGDPHSLDGAGCYALCIEITANRYFEENGYDTWRAEALIGEPPEVLYGLVQKGFPLAVWVTTGWKTPYVNGQWYTEDGDLVTWMFPEHCLVLVGYDLDAGTVTVSDVEYGYNITVSMEQFEYIYDCMGSQAVVLRQGNWELLP